MELAADRERWEEIASQDPFWAVLSYSDRKYGRWDRDEFFATGEVEIEEIRCHVESLGRRFGGAAALDFGCGLGRLTRALTKHYDSALGVDISHAMVEQATLLNADVPLCSFRVNVTADLASLTSDAFDLVLTNIVLQHLPDQATVSAYLLEFLRVLRPGGLLVFQLPSRLPFLARLQPRRNAYLLLRRLGFNAQFLYWRLGLHPNRMIALSPISMTELLEHEGAQVLDVVTRRDRYVQRFVESIYYVSSPL